MLAMVWKHDRGVQQSVKEMLEQGSKYPHGYTRVQVSYPQGYGNCTRPGYMSCTLRGMIYMPAGVQDLYPQGYTEWDVIKVGLYTYTNI